jgi:hypothetical protein
MALSAAQRLDAGVVRALKVSSSCLPFFPSSVHMSLLPWATQLLSLCDCISLPLLPPFLHRFLSLLRAPRYRA